MALSVPAVEVDPDIPLPRPRVSGGHLKELRAFISDQGHPATLLADELYEGFGCGVSGADPWQGGHRDRGDFLGCLKCFLLSAEPLCLWRVRRSLFKLLEALLGNSQLTLSFYYERCDTVLPLL